MTSRDTKLPLQPHAKRSLVQRAVGIVTVDGIGVSDSVREMLSKCEAGAMTFDQARQEIISRARAMADAKNLK